MSINWTSVEKLIYSLSKKDIRKFAKGHPGEVFYGFFMDCDSSYSQVLLHLEANENLLKRVEAAKKKGLYKDWSYEQIEEAFRWSAGDWSYFQINDWGEKWSRMADKIEKHIEQDHSGETFMKTACRALLLLEADGIFDLLNRTRDFKIWCADHDEPLPDAEKRLKKMRREMRNPKTGNK